MAALNLEALVFNSLLDWLKTGLTSYVDSIAGKAFAIGLIDRPAMNAATVSSAPPDPRTLGLLNAIGSKIEGDPKAFYTFIEILKGEESWKYLAKNLGIIMHVYNIVRKCMGVV